MMPGLAGGGAWACAWISDKGWSAREQVGVPSLSLNRCSGRMSAGSVLAGVVARTSSWDKQQ